MEVILPSLFTALTALILGYLLHKREVGKHRLEIEKYRNEIDLKNKEQLQDRIKLDFFNRAMDLSRINPIIEGVDKVFENTIADRFLILIAINGKTDFNVVNVIFEQHKPSVHKVNAIGTYRNVNIDELYRQMLKRTEAEGVVELNVEQMSPSILKDFYEIEGVKHSKIRFLGRESIDEDNDFLIYSSLATHEDFPFSNLDKAYIKTVYEGTIIPNITEIVH